MNKDLDMNISVYFEQNLRLDKENYQEHFLNFEREMFHVDSRELIEDVRLLFEGHFYGTIFAENKQTVI